MAPGPVDRAPSSPSYMQTSHSATARSLLHTAAVGRVRALRQLGDPGADAAAAQDRKMLSAARADHPRLAEI